LSDEENATADLLNRVAYVEYFQNEKGKQTTRKRITKYQKLIELENVNYNNVFPIVGRDLAAFLGLQQDEEDETNALQSKNRYAKYLTKITGFYREFLNKDDFRKVVPISENGFDNANPMQIGKTTPQSKELIFGHTKTFTRNRNSTRKHGLEQRKRKIHCHLPHADRQTRPRQRATQNLLQSERKTA
jgi:hypothetical protein